MPRKGLNIRIDGEVVRKYEDRVSLVQVMGSRGEIARLGVAEADEVLDIVVTLAGNRNRNLQDELAEQRERDRERAKKAEEDLGPEGSASLSGSGNFKEIGVRPDESIDPRGANSSDSSDSSKSSSSKKDDKK